ncbi:MAG: hypothetical protein K9M99_03250 [Candidatus Cloacimonetes bacterium]|nr:hypothetical protein [Candidatus Cloacimonadota bacterium]
MKKIILLGLLVAFILLFTACSEDDNNDNLVEPEIIYAYSLDQFVPAEIFADQIIHDDDDDYDWRNLFYFWSVADDGYSPRPAGYDDLNWNDMAQGVYIPLDKNRIRFPQYDSLGVGAYNVKWINTVHVYRGVRTNINDTLSVVFEFNGMDVVQVENYDGGMENAIPLADFIPEHVTVLDSVTFTAIDGYQQTYYPEEIEAGYWLIDSQKTIFPGLDLPGSKKKFKFLQSTQIFGAYEEIEEYINPAMADENSADWSFSFPEDLTGYIGEVWE